MCRTLESEGRVDAAQEVKANQQLIFGGQKTVISTRRKAGHILTAETAEASPAFRLQPSVRIMWSVVYFLLWPQIPPIIPLADVLSLRKLLLPGPQHTNVETNHILERIYWKPPSGSNHHEAHLRHVISLYCGSVILHLLPLSFDLEPIEFILLL